MAEKFYGIHADKPFFGELTEFMSSGPIVMQVLEGENAVLKNREIMGATNPAKLTLARSARNLRKALAKTRCMGQTASTMQRLKLPCVFPQTNWSARSLLSEKI